MHSSAGGARKDWAADRAKGATGSRPGGGAPLHPSRAAEGAGRHRAGSGGFGRHPTRGSVEEEDDDVDDADLDGDDGGDDLDDGAEDDRDF